MEQKTGTLWDAVMAIAAKSGVCLADYVCSPEQQIERLNSRLGDLSGYDCPICKNKGFVYIRDGEYMDTVPCDCMAIRETIRQAKCSGLYAEMQRYRLNNFNHSQEFQKQMLQAAREFLDTQGNWFYIGGQSGCGKTHICTGIFGQLIKRGVVPAKYITWRDDIDDLKRCVNDQEEYNRRMSKYKQAPLLYIDDFFKVRCNDGGAKFNAITDSDYRIAYQLINARYRDPNCITLISSEFSLEQIIRMDEAIGGRIRQRCENFYLSIAPDKSKNYRL